MNKKFALETAYKMLAPFLADIAKTYPTIREVTSVKFRGYNPKSLNSPRQQNSMTLWVNLEKGTVDNPCLLKRNKELLKTVWAMLMNELGDDLDRVTIAPIGGEVYVPGIYPSSIFVDDRMPAYQLR